MVAMEKAGIPAVAIAAQSFARAWQSCVDGWGQPTTAYVIIPHATTGQQTDFIRNMVDGQIDAIIQGLTTFPASRGPVTAQKTGGATEVFTVEMDASPDGLDAVNRFLAERDWSDGIPVIPPTPELVERMLAGTSRSPQDVLMVMEPGFGVATVEKVAVNAVMAGCRPEQFPVLLAAIDCLAQPEMNHRDMQVSGHTEAPLILVNGPIAQRAGINCGTSAMGPGVVNSANTSIGRALRLCLINIGYCKAGTGDPNFIGLPTKFGMCIAENEELSPWQPYHVDQGFQAHESAVTVVTVTGPGDILDSGSRNHKDTLNNIASLMFYPGAGSGGWIRGWQSAQVGIPANGCLTLGRTIPLCLVLPARSFCPKPGTASGTLRNGCTSIAGFRCRRPSAAAAYPRTRTANGCITRNCKHWRTTRTLPFRCWKARSSTCCS